MSQRRPGDYVRAFFTAARMTLRGEAYPARAAGGKYPLTAAWLTEITAALAAAEAQARANSFNPAELVLHIEGRDVSMRTMLDAIHFHAAREYPSLLNSSAEHALLVIKATNLNDRHWLLRLEQADSLPGFMRDSIRQLASVLDNQPPE